MTSDPFVVVGTGAALVTAALWRWFPAVPPSSPGGARPGPGSQYADLARTPRAAGRFGTYLMFQAHHRCLSAQAPVREPAAGAWRLR